MITLKFSPISVNFAIIILFAFSSASSANALNWVTSTKSMSQSEAALSSQSQVVVSDGESRRIESAVDTVWKGFLEHSQVASKGGHKPVVLITKSTFPIVKYVSEHLRFIEIGTDFTRHLSVSELNFVIAHEFAHYFFHEPNSPGATEIYGRSGKRLDLKSESKMLEAFELISRLKILNALELGFFSHDYTRQVLNTVIQNLEMKDTASQCLAKYNASEQDLSILSRQFSQAIDPFYQTMSKENLLFFAQRKKEIFLALKDCGVFVDRREVDMFESYLSEVISHNTGNLSKDLSGVEEYLSEIILSFRSEIKRAGYISTQWPGLYTIEDEADDVALNVLKASGIKYSVDFITKLSGLTGEFRKTPIECKGTVDPIVVFDIHRLPCDRKMRLKSLTGLKKFSNLLK